MTSGAKKEKARKKRREQKLLEEQQQRVDEEKAQLIPPYGNNPDSDDNDRPIPSAADIHAFIYGPLSRSLSPPPSWYNDAPNMHAILTIHTTPSQLLPRDFSILRSESAHPWCPIRRRNRRLLPGRRPFPQSLPKRLPAQELPLPTPSAPIHTLILSSNPDDPVPPLALLRPIPLPTDPYDFLPMQREPPPCALPAATAYGTVQSALAIACSLEFPWVHVAIGRISETAWGPHPDERQNSLIFPVTNSFSSPHSRR
ncbi:hypothetical protein B0H17DRAFT_1141680 [Mycena rosella]|uniref:Uncharacterized protein n=1 Tax=Mycena rosella TaxID=1033263 RepID=A0AAD7CZ39_MYCRO|nr:hypothetical protein B0H17DRAFT_1141680 [Mycena rosella]